MSALINRMIEAGVPAGEAGDIAAQIYAAGVASASVRSSGAERTRRWRKNVTKRHTASQSDGDDEASQTVTERHKPSQSDASTMSPIEEDLNKKDSRPHKRGTRIDPLWNCTQEDYQFAVDEGFGPTEIEREKGKFRDYWGAKSGRDAAKLDWSKTWRNWIRNAAERAGKPPSVGKTPAEEIQVDWDKQVGRFRAGYPWSAKWYGPEPGHLGCRAPPEIQAKHGYIALPPDAQRN